MASLRGLRVFGTPIDTVEGKEFSEKPLDGSQTSRHRRHLPSSPCDCHCCCRGHINDDTRDAYGRIRLIRWHYREIMIFFVGCCVGGVLVFLLFKGSLLSLNPLVLSQGSTYAVPPQSFVLQLDDIPARSTSHVDPQSGTTIRKQQLVEPFSLMNNLAGFSVATMTKGQTVTSHQHASMHEFFFILSGSGNVRLHDRDFYLQAGSFVHVAPHTSHTFWATNDGDPLRMLLCGIINPALE